MDTLIVTIAVIAFLLLMTPMVLLPFLKGGSEAPRHDAPPAHMPIDSRRGHGTSPSRDLAA